MTRRYLLTGAGFTHNFGAPLATEMWALILNHVDGKQAPELKRRLLANFDFEDVYQQVMDSTAEQEQDALNVAVQQAYRVVDEIVTNFKFVSGSRHPVNIYKVQKLIGAFATSGREPGFCFTLNQDLFLERQHYNDPRPIIPGVQQRQEWFSSTFRQPLNDSLYCRLPSAEDLEQQKRMIRDGFYYIKLHGSCNWLDAGGKNRMVLGSGKSQQIEKEPLLAWYQQLFTQALTSGDVRLMVAGYGFGDRHINKILADAVVNANLQIFILSPEAPSTFCSRITRLERGSDLWSGIAGYFQSTLSNLFPENQEDTPEWSVIQERFFQSKVR